jgi:large subunit ribosomal protein L15
MPYIRRIPKRGFNNARFGTEYVPVNLSDLQENFEANTTVDVVAIKAVGLANGKGEVSVKILGNGKLEKKLFVKAHAFSGSAQKAIEGAGGSCEVLKGNKSSTDCQEAPEQEAPEQEAPEQEAPEQEAPEQEAPEQEAPEGDSSAE